MKPTEPSIWDYKIYLNRLYSDPEAKTKVYDKFVYLTDSARERPMKLDKFNIALRTNAIGTTFRKYDFAAFSESFKKDKIRLVK